MKGFLKGCLVTIGVLFRIISIGVIALLIYYILPNKIEFSDHQIKSERYLDELAFEGRELPNFILEQNEEAIIYQLFINNESFLDKTVLYRTVIKIDNDMELENALPFSPTDEERINRKIGLNEIGTDSFNLLIGKPNYKKTSSGKHMTVYSPQNKILMNLKSGGYSYIHKEVDKVGYVTDIAIYDKENKLLYFERKRYYAFQ